MPEEEELSLLGFIDGEADGNIFYWKKGCQYCNNTGFKGRLGLFEASAHKRKIKRFNQCNDKF